MWKSKKLNLDWDWWQLSSPVFYQEKNSSTCSVIMEMSRSFQLHISRVILHIKRSLQTTEHFWTKKRERLTSLSFLQLIWEVVCVGLSAVCVDFVRIQGSHPVLLRTKRRSSHLALLLVPFLVLTHHLWPQTRSYKGEGITSDALLTMLFRHHWKSQYKSETLSDNYVPIPREVWDPALAPFAYGSF